MRLRKLYARGIYPLQLQTDRGIFSMEFYDPFDDGDRVLLIGSNGSGKSTVLKIAALLWKAYLAYSGLLFAPQPLPEPHAQAALRISGLFPEDLLIIQGDAAFWDEVSQLEPDATPVGYREGERTGEGMLYGEAQPNMLYLNADDMYSQESLVSGVDDALITEGARFTIPQITSHWKECPENTEDCLAMLNNFFKGKRFEVVNGDVRVVVGDHVHGIKRLSAGEKHSLAILFALHYYLREGGIVLADEPDMHLHYAVVPGLIAAMENIIDEKGGQFILTSHVASLKQRYERLGLVIPMDDREDAY